MWGKCLFLSLPFDPDLNESWFKLWHVKTNLKDALGTGNRAASRRSGFKKSQIVKTSWSKFFVFQSSLSDFAPTARPRDARSKSRQVGQSCIRSRSRHWRVWKRGLQGDFKSSWVPQEPRKLRSLHHGNGTFFFCMAHQEWDFPGLGYSDPGCPESSFRIVLVRFHQLLVSRQLGTFEAWNVMMPWGTLLGVQYLPKVCSGSSGMGKMHCRSKSINSRSLSAKLKSTTAFYRLWHVGRDWQKGLRRVLQTPTLDSIWIDAFDNATTRSLCQGARGQISLPAGPAGNTKCEALRDFSPRKTQGVEL